LYNGQLLLCTNKITNLNTILNILDQRNIKRETKMIFTPDKQTNPINNLTNPINNFTHISIAHRQLTGLQKKKS